MVLRLGILIGVGGVSPSVFEPFADAIRRLRSPFRLFVSSGAFEPRIDKPTQQFISALEFSPPLGSLDFLSRHYLDDSHALTPLVSLTDGLRFIFEPIGLAVSSMNKLDGESDSTSIVTAFSDVTIRYSAGARAIGLDTLLPEAFALQSGASVLRNMQKPGAARVILNWVVRAYPQSVAAHETFADALAAAGDTLLADTEYARAIVLANAAGDSSVSGIHAKQRAMKQPASPPR